MIILPFCISYEAVSREYNTSFEKFHICLHVFYPHDSSPVCCFISSFLCSGIDWEGDILIFFLSSVLQCLHYKIFFFTKSPCAYKAQVMDSLWRTPKGWLLVLRHIVCSISEKKLVIGHPSKLVAIHVVLSVSR